MKEEIVRLIIAYSTAMNFDPGVALSVARTESNFNQQAIGSVGEIGVFQLRPEFFEDDIKNVEINIITGISYLKEVKERCVHKEDLNWLVCYNAGVTGGNKYKSPEKSEYVLKVKQYMKELENAGSYEDSIQEANGRYVAF